MELPPELEFDRLGYEQKFHKAVPGYMRRIAALYEALLTRKAVSG